MPDSTLNEVRIVFDSPSQSASFYDWFKNQGGVEEFMAADVAHELPDTLITASKPKTGQSFFFFHFK